MTDLEILALEDRRRAEAEARGVQYIGLLNNPEDEDYNPDFEDGIKSNYRKTMFQMMLWQAIVCIVFSV